MTRSCSSSAGDLEKDFREVIGNRIEKVARVEYAFQELGDLPEGFSVPGGEEKALGNRPGGAEHQGACGRPVPGDQRG